MPEKSPSRSERIELLQKSNKHSPSLSRRLLTESERFEHCSRRLDGILLDFSRTGVGQREFDELIDLARHCDVEGQRQRLYEGERLNFTEQRAVLHPLWRERDFTRILSAREAERLEAAQMQMSEIADALHGGRLPEGKGGRRVRDVIHIGIGGSLLGPRLLCEAFPPSGECPRIHFLSSVDAFERERLLARIDPRETVVILVSKSFSTAEVLAHAQRIRRWQRAALEESQANRRLFAVTANPDKAEAFGVPASHILEMGSWTGGRFSVWSPVGLSAAVAMGSADFEAFLDGGAATDRHFREASLEDNLPVILALISVWHRNVCGRSVHGLIPYDGRLRSLPAWLQQVEMESNGKSVNRRGGPVSMETSPVVMGETGTDAQHALFQAFHQGTGIVPLDFIGVIEPDHDDRDAQGQLLSHMLAQATALAVGRDRSQARDVMRTQAVPELDIDSLLPHRVMPGNRPSVLILLDRLTPASLGRLLAIYEHKVFVESVIWEINAFDQWGVELGKSLADAIEPALRKGSSELPPDIPGLDGLIDYIRERSGD